MLAFPAMGRRHASFAAIGALLASRALAACGGGDEDATGETSSGEVHVVAYPGLKPAYANALEPAFERIAAFEPVDFAHSFGESGEQSRAVADGAPASMVHVERAGEMEQLVDEGI